jgi:flagellar basal body-associated protein FliL
MWIISQDLSTCFLVKNDKTIFTLIMSRKKKKSIEIQTPKSQAKSIKKTSFIQIMVLIVALAVFLVPILSLVVNKATPAQRQIQTTVQPESKQIQISQPPAK